MAAAATTTTRREMRVWTDGSCWGHELAGAAFVWFDGNGAPMGAYRSLRCERVLPAEVAAIHMALVAVRELVKMGSVVDELIITTDSRTALRKIGKVRAWEWKFKGTRVDEVVRELGELRERGTAVRLEWQRSKSSRGNRVADEWAKQGSSLSWEKGPGLTV